MSMHLPDDCECYQELLSTPYNVLSEQQQEVLKDHLQQCSACVRFREESGMLPSLLSALLVPDIKPGVPPQVEKFLKIAEYIQMDDLLELRSLSTIGGTSQGIPKGSHSNTTEGVR